MSLDKLKPTETDQAMAFARLIEAHIPRSATIGHTGMHACVVCDEIWPCDVAVIVAGYREFRRLGKSLATKTMYLADIARIAADIIEIGNFDETKEEKQIDLIRRLTDVVERMSKEPT